MQDISFGHVEVQLDEVIKRSNLSKNKIANLSQMQRTQLNNYCKGKVQRMDLSTLARLCYALDCDISDILKYVPPQNV